MEYIQNIIQGTTVVNALLIMVSAIVCDLISGVIKAFYDGNFKSGNLRKGLYKKLEWIVMMMFCYILYLLTGVDKFPYGIAVICAFTEFLSIVENLIQMGLVKAEWITKFFGVSIEKEEE